MDALEGLDRLRVTLEAHLIPSQKSSPELKPSLNSAEIERLEWKPYHEGHSAGWIFTDKAPASLTELLEKGPVTVGSFTYKYSGPEEKPRLFVSRAPVKGEQD
jgi:hypothetical protein